MNSNDDNKNLASATRELNFAGQQDEEGKKKMSKGMVFTFLTLMIIVCGLGLKMFLGGNEANSQKKDLSVGVMDAQRKASGITDAVRNKEYTTIERERQGLASVDEIAKSAKEAEDMRSIQLRSKKKAFEEKQKGVDAKRDIERNKGVAQKENSATTGGNSNSKKGMNSPGGKKVVQSIIPSDLKKRMHPEYQKWLNLQNNFSSIAFELKDGQIPQATSNIENLNSVIEGIDNELQDLYRGGGKLWRGGAFSFPAGEEIRAYTNHVIQTDYPSAISATIVAPKELKGATVIVNYSGVNIERAGAIASKIVYESGGEFKEYNLSGVIRTDLPYLDGDVNHHYWRRILPAVINAGIAGGALYLASEDQGDDISTSDELYNSMVVAGVAGVQKEITGINAGKPPITVTVPEGTEFTILLTSRLDID
jgi:type IV secretory pathway VirB10-like protein